jgi:hypothetical protein
LLAVWREGWPSRPWALGARTIVRLRERRSTLPPGLLRRISVPAEHAGQRDWPTELAKGAAQGSSPSELAEVLAEVLAKVLAKVLADQRPPGLSRRAAVRES